MTLDVSAVFGDKTVYYAPAVISLRHYGVIKRDYDTYWPPDERWPLGIAHVSRPTRNKANNTIFGLPATCRSEGDVIVKMTETLQRFVHIHSSAMASLDPNEDYAKRSFAKLTRGNAYAFDFAGSNTNHDYINNTNTDAEDIKNKVMLTSGDLFEILGDTVKAGNPCWIIKAINVLKDDVWKYSVADNPELWGTPKTSRREGLLSNGKWAREDRVIPFDMYSDKVIMWWFSNDGFLYIPKFRAEQINSLDDRPPIYV